MGYDLGPQYGEDEGNDEIPCAYSPDRMTPRRNIASEGRANPKGLPCLYLATDKETAMSEVRPWINSTISILMMQSW